MIQPETSWASDRDHRRIGGSTALVGTARWNPRSARAPAPSAGDPQADLGRHSRADRPSQLGTPSRG